MKNHENGNNNIMSFLRNEFHECQYSEMICYQVLKTGCITMISETYVLSTRYLIN